MQSKTERQENARKLRIKNLNNWNGILFDLVNSKDPVKAYNEAAKIDTSINDLLPGNYKQLNHETKLALIKQHIDKKIRAHKEDIMRLNIKLNNDRHDFNI